MAISIKAKVFIVVGDLSRFMLAVNAVSYCVAFQSVFVPDISILVAVGFDFFSAVGTLLREETIGRIWNPFVFARMPSGHAFCRKCRAFYIVPESHYYSCGVLYLGGLVGLSLKELSGGGSIELAANLLYH